VRWSQFRFDDDGWKRVIALDTPPVADRTLKERGAAQGETITGSPSESSLSCSLKSGSVGGNTRCLVTCSLAHRPCSAWRAILGQAQLDLPHARQVRRSHVLV
jgi:hypothetical protein